MNAAALDISQDDVSTEEAVRNVEKTCEELGLAVADGKLGDIVVQHEKMILHYYRDVQEQAQRSYATARRFGWSGFGVLIATLFYVTVLDALGRFGVIAELSPKAGQISAWMTVGSVGVLSGVLIEFIAGVGFWLYRRTSEQFAAFHICLERTHRYLIAYRIASEISGDDKEKTLRDLVCIMAKAPMITRNDLGIGKPTSETPAAAPAP
jgi:TRADD-N domain-containing protein